MLYRFIAGSFFLILQLTFSANSHAIDASDKDNPLAFINYAINQQKSNPAVAFNALEQAYSLATKQKNLPLVAKTLIEQAQTAKIQKNYALAELYLIKAEAIIPTLKDYDLSVEVLTNMSSIQRYLKNYEESMDYVQKALTIARKSGESKLIFKSLQIKGTLLQNTNRYADAIAIYISAQRYMSDITSANKVRLYRDTANAYNKVNEYESGIRYYNKALKHLESINDIKSMPNTIIDLAKIQAKTGDFSQALENANRSLALSREYKSEKDILKSLVVLSILYRKISSYEDALSHGLEAIEIYRKNNDFNGIAASTNSVGLAYLHLSQSENAKTYFAQVLDIPIEDINIKFRAAALRGLGKLLFEEEQHIKGLKMSNEAHDLYEKIGDRNGVATVKKNLGYFYYKMGNLRDSMDAYNTSITIFQSMKDVWNEAECKAYLSFAIVDVDVEKSISLANNSLDLALKLGAKSIAQQAYNTLILAEENRENYKQALAYTKIKESLTNEIKTDAINKRIAEMRIILDVEKKEREFERLKREKSVISLELDNKKNKLNLLEKEKEVADLKNENTLIIISISIVVIILGLLIVGRLYFNLNYGSIVTAIFILVILLYSFNSNSKDIIKITISDSALDVRPKYTLAVLEKALELSSESYGLYELRIINEHLSNNAKRWELYDGNYINLTMAMSSPDWEYLTLPVRIPLRRGIGSYRLLAINKQSLQRFSKITTVRELKSLTVGLQKEWIMNEYFEEEGFEIVESSTYDGVFRMLNKNRFDFTPRGIHEGYDELFLREDELKNLVLEPHLALHIPQPYYIFVSPKFPRIAERVEFGLEKMIAEGILQKMFNEHFSEFIKKANLSNRTIIHLGNKYLTKQTPLERKELWLRFDFEK
jgi:tetratricopeptide (TPR) repeat protein